jgi:hypothetical protein
MECLNQTKLLQGNNFVKKVENVKINSLPFPHSEIRPGHPFLVAICVVFLKITVSIPALGN